MQDIHVPIVGTVSGLALAQAVNTGFDSLQQNIGGVLNKSVAGGADVTLSAAEANNGIINLTGALTANINVIVPASAMQWVFCKQTTGAYSVSVKTSAGLGVAIGQGIRTQLICDGSDVLALSTSAARGLFYKTDPTTVAFIKTGAGAASIKAGSKIDVAGTLVEFASTTAITMPTLTVGTDYAIWVKDDGTLQASTGFTSAPGAGNWRKIGGFHYAPGGHSGSPGGGNTTSQINEYSLWDLKFRPACSDPRSMTLVADGFWADIYLLGVDHQTNGTSKYNVTIADGSSPPKVPALFGGNGTTAYSSLTWWEANEVLCSWGKRSPSYQEFAAMAYGTTEASSIGSDPVSTTWNAAYISKWGIAQATGNMWVWGDEFGGGAAGASWTANTGGRGSTYQMENAVIFGGSWVSTSVSGSRASYWGYSPAYSYSDIGARGVCDHLILE